MTAKLKDESQFTDFSIWLSKQERLSSAKGYVTTDIDFWWRNYKVDKHMIVETKTYMAEVGYSQDQSLMRLDKLIRAGSPTNYYGLNLLQFQKTTPDNGMMFINGKAATLEQLYLFFEFALPPEWYVTNLAGTNMLAFQMSQPEQDILKYIDGL